MLFQIKTHQPFYAVEQEEQKRRFPLWLGVLLLVIFTIAIAICGEYLVDSMSGLSEAWGINPTFIGMVLLPVVSKSFELFDTISIAMKNKAQTVIEKAIGSSTQTAPFIAPVLVIVGWVIGQPMSLLFNTFLICVMFSSVILVNH